MVSHSISRKFFINSRNLNRGLPRLEITPVKRYDNAFSEKTFIFNDNKEKAFIYRWVNKINGHEYLGSTLRGYHRIRDYYNNNKLNSDGMLIYKAILEYGHINFIFDIIEYCSPEELLDREQYYLDNYDFEYNTKPSVKSWNGFKHNQETIQKLKDLNTGKLHTEDVKDEMRIWWAKNKVDSSAFAAKKATKSFKVKNEITSDHKWLNWPGKVVVVTNLDTNTSTEFRSVTSAASFLNVENTTLRRYIKSQKVFTMFTKPEDNSDQDLIKLRFKINYKD